MKLDEVTYKNQINEGILICEDSNRNEFMRSEVLQVLNTSRSSNQKYDLIRNLV